MGIKVEFGVPSCGQFSPTATYAQAEDVDNHGVPVEQTQAQRYPRSGELDSELASGASVTTGSPHHWIVDLDPPAPLLAHHLAEDFGYADSGAVIGVFTTTVPFPARLQLGLLR